jgi:hypothetical protein
LTQIPAIQSSQKIQLGPGRTGYRYYLVWITSLPAGKDYAAINEIALYGLSR